MRALMLLCMMVTTTMVWAIDVSTAKALKDALNGSNTEIKLTGDIEVSETLVLTGALDVNLDLAGHTLVGNGCRALWIKNGSLTISSTENGGTVSTIGTIADNSSVIRVGDTEGETRNVVLTVEKNVTVSTEKCYGITVFGSKTLEKLVVKGKVTTTGVPAISGNGNAEYAGTTILIDDDAEITTTNEVAIYHPQNGKLTVNGTVKGAGGIEIKAGELIVTEKAKITATGTISHTVNNDGCSTSGYAIAIVENSLYLGVSTISIDKNATIDGPIAMVKDSENNKTANATFDGEGLQMLVKVKDSEGKSFGQYLSLELAMADAPAGCTATLLGDCEIASTIVTTKNYTLDLNVYTLTSNGQRALWIKSGEVTISSSSTDGKIEIPTCSDASAILVGSSETTAVSLTVGENVTILASQGSGILLTGTNTSNSLTVKGTVNTTDASAIAGTKDMTGTLTITVAQGAQVSATNAVAIYQPQNGSLTVNGIVSGAGGIELKSGKLSVGEHANITATGTPTHAAQTDAPSSLGYAIAIVENDAYAPTDPTITINNNATISGPIAELQDSENSSFAPSYSGNAVIKKVAAIGNDEYFTLKDAVDIVPSEGKVTLLADLSLSETLVMDKLKTYTLDLAGKMLTGSGCVAIQVAGGHVTLDGAAGSKVTVSGTPTAAILLGGNSGANRVTTLVINSNVEVVSALSTGILLKGTATRETLVVNGKITTTGYNAIIAADEIEKIHIANTGEVTASNAVAVYQTNVGELIVDGKITGQATAPGSAGAVEMKGGNLTVNSSAKIVAAGTTAHQKKDDVPSTNGYAIALVENPAFPGVGKINISKDAATTGIIAYVVDEANTQASKPKYTGDVYMVAETAGNKYAKLPDAISEASNNGEVKLLDDLTLTNTLSISKPITLIMSNYSLIGIGNQESGATVAIDCSGTVNLQKGGITSGSKSGISVTKGTVNLTQMTVNTADVALAVTSGTVTADNTSSFTSTAHNTISIGGGTVQFEGKAYNTSTTNGSKHAIAATDDGSLTIADRTVISSSNGHGIDWQSTGTLTVEGGKITGAEAIAASAGDVTISGGSFTGTGHALNITATACAPTVSGGTFICGTDDDYKPIAAADGVSKFVSGEYFSKAIPQAICADQYTVAPNPKSNGMYYLVDEIVINDGTNWTVPSESFVIGKAKYVRNSGMGAAGTKFGTLCLPFSYTATQTDMTFYKVKSIDTEKGELYLETLSGTIEAGTPVVFGFSSATTGFMIESQNASISNAAAGSGNNLVGTFNKTELTSGTSTKVDQVYYLNSDAFHQAKTSLTVPAYRAYIKIDLPSPSPARAEVLSIFVEDESTDLNAAIMEQGEEQIFDMQGNLQDSLMPGMNIVKMANGRTIKVYVNK